MNYHEDHEKMALEAMGRAISPGADPRSLSIRRRYLDSLAYERHLKGDAAGSDFIRGLAEDIGEQHAKAVESLQSKENSNGNA